MWHMNVSIIIVCFGQRAVTEACLASLADALGPKLGTTWKIVLVDNASPDDTLDLFAQSADRATLVPLRENRNFAGGCNAGAAAASGDVLVFLNNDTIVVPGALETLVEQAREPGVGATGPRLLFPDGTIQHAGVWMVRDLSGLPMPYHLFIDEPGDLAPAAIQADLDCVTGACLVTPAAVFREVGGFDEGYRNGWEDVDLCLRIRASGRRVVYRGDVSFVHAERATRASAPSWETRNSERFLKRWGQLLDDDGPAFAEIWDAAYSSGTPERTELGATAVVGAIRGIGPAAAHTRAIVAALERQGMTPAAQDAVEPIIVPRLDHATWTGVWRAMGRTPAPGAGVIDALGLPTPVIPSPLTHGGRGALVLLPAHDLPGARQTLEAAVGTGLPLTVLPSSATTPLATLVERIAPAAHRHAAASSEAALVNLAGACDVVFAVDPADRWDRAALLSAATGAAVVVREDGPAAEILGDLAGTLSAGPRAVEARAARRELVASACADATVLASFLKAREPEPTTRA
jgi:GT2 family glycosyltransferase